MPPPGDAVARADGVSLVVFLLTALIIGIIAKALVSGDTSTGVTILVGAVAQVLASVALQVLGWGRYGQPWTFFVSVAVAAIMLSLYEQSVPAQRPRGEIEAAEAAPAVPSRAEVPMQPPTPPSFGEVITDCSEWAVIGGMVMGATGFLIGFYGPMRFQPWANQGPMVGIFLTGPGGALLGAIVGASLRWVHPEWTSHRRMGMLGAANVAWGLFVLDLVVDRAWWH